MSRSKDFIPMAEKKALGYLMIFYLVKKYPHLNEKQVRRILLYAYGQLVEYSELFKKIKELAAKT